MSLVIFSLVFSKLYLFSKLKILYVYLLNKISLPTTNLDKTLCTRFGDFFSEKVEKLCYNLDLQRQLLPTDTTILTTTCKHTFTEFERPTITD